MIMEKKRIFFAVLCNVINLLLSIKAQSILEYVSPALSGPVDYTRHDLYEDGVDIQNTSFVSFQVKSEGNAYVLLQANRDDYENDAVEIGLGVSNNTGVSIKNKQRYTWRYMPDVVSGSEFREFWISWAHHTVWVGKGKIPHRRSFKLFENISYDINYISIGTAYNTSGHWKFDTAWFESATISPTASGVGHTDGHVTIPRNEDEGNDQTAVYISVPITIILAVVIAAIIVITFRKRRNTKMINKELEVVYSGNGSEEGRQSVIPGIDNPVYNTLCVESQEQLKNGVNANEEGSEDDHYTKVTDKATQPAGTSARPFENLGINRTDESEEEHTYDQLKQVESTKGASELNTETAHNLYSHTIPLESCKTKRNSSEEQEYQRINQLQNTTNDSDNKSTAIGEPEDENSPYDHATADRKSEGRVDSQEYSHPDETENN